MRPVTVVVPHEFGQHRPQVLFVQHDDVVQTFSTECSDDTFGDRVRTWRSNGRCDAVDSHLSGSLAEIVAVDSVAIAQQVPRLLAPGCCVDQLTPDPRSSRVGRHIDMHQLAPAMGDEDHHVQRLNASMGTVNRSAAHRWCAWLARNVRQVWLGGRLGPRQR